MNFETLSANSVESLQLVAVAEVRESHQNLATLYADAVLTNFLSLPGIFIVGDCKVNNMLCGLMLGKYPCIYCKWDRADGFMKTSRASARSWDDYVKGYERLMTEFHGDSQKYAVRCDGVEAMPAIKFEDPLDKFAPPELHIMLGVVGKIYKDMKAKMTAAQIKHMEDSLKAHGILQKPYFGGTFEGNQTRTILKLVGEGVDFGMNVPRTRQLFLALQSFNNVVVACFGLQRERNYQEKIVLFEQAYLDAKLSVTLKVHILVEHVPRFLETKAPTGQEGLALHSSLSKPQSQLTTNLTKLGSATLFIVTVPCTQTVCFVV
eukprot:Pompholyxophrys_punicea_v1_NODE_575_length_1667_cov_11.192808.p1 type:complete len:320 gc:universal NODE_575_length_1667_cov_11.192808:138-1097(+)